jgi:tetratricopeptide (TPR) repeat protein
MRHPVLIVASISALLTFGAGRSAKAQQPSDSGQGIPDAPQPQKKPASKPQPSDSSTPPADKPDSTPKATKDENPFPEAASREAAKSASDGSPDAGTASPKPFTKDDNPFPETVSRDAAKAASGGSPDTGTASPKPSSAKDDNPFPESVSRDAAKAAGNESSPVPAAKPDLPPGVSSSRSAATSGADDEVSDPTRAKKDTEVADFYIKAGDYQGALARYTDAMAADPGNVEAIFGLAETQRMLKKNAEAAQNYQLYLDIVPNGPRAKQALKALKSLGAGG